MEVRVGELREDMGCESNAVERILRHGCGRARVPVPGETARPAQRRRQDADTGVLTPYATGTARALGVYGPPDVSL
jgi:hypothetical protein